MIEPTLLSRVEDALRAIEQGGSRLTFVAVAQRAGVSRTSLYRPALRALVEERRSRGREACTLTSLSSDLARLHGSLADVVSQLCQQQARLRRLEGQPREPDHVRPCLLPPKDAGGEGRAPAPKPP
jgi:hypothetical protein